MHVLVRVEVSRVFAHQAAKSGELAGSLFGNGACILHGNHLVHLGPTPVAAAPFAKIEVKAQAQARVIPAVRGRFRYGRPTHHEAGTRDDPTLMRLDNSPVYSAALAEV